MCSWFWFHIKKMISKCFEILKLKSVKSELSQIWIFWACDITTCLDSLLYKHRIFYFIYLFFLFYVMFIVIFFQISISCKVKVGVFLFIIIVSFSQMKHTHFWHAGQKQSGRYQIWKKKSLCKSSKETYIR